MVARTRRGHDADAIDRLHRVERIGSQALRANPQAQRLIAELLQRGRRSALPGIRSPAPYAAHVTG
jgi:hypothetical protein